MKSWKPGEWVKGRLDRWLRDYPRATPIGIFLFVLTLVGASAWSVELAGERTRRSDAKIQASEIAGAIERQAASNGAYLEATSALFMSLHNVSPDFFRQFIDRLRVAYDLTGVVGIGWSEVVPANEVPALEARMRAAGHPDFRIHPEHKGATGERHVITMLEPENAPNAKTLGFDMHSEARRAAAMDKARRTGRIAASDTVTLVQDSGGPNSPGFLVYAPVNTFGRGVFKGFVYSPIRTRDFILAAAKTRLPTTGRVDIVDLNAKGREPIFSLDNKTGALATPVEQSVSVFDQQWVLLYYPPSDKSLSPLTLTVLVGGVAFSLLLLAYILLAQRRNEDLQTLVAAQAEREAERASFVRELNHRVKNSLSNVTSIISLTRRNTTDLDSFTSSLLERVRALAASHSLLDGAQWGPTDLKALVETQVSSHDHADGRIRMNGQHVLISPNDALSIGLALHELLTNAARYGALSSNEGQVSIAWHVDGEAVSVLWEEHGGPPVIEPAKRGFGLNLIERALAQELGSPIVIDFLPGGLRCKFAVPLRTPKSFRLRR